MANRDALLDAADAAARLIDDHRRRCRFCARNVGGRGADPAQPYEDCTHFYRLRREAYRARWAYEGES